MANLAVGPIGSDGQQGNISRFFASKLDQHKIFRKPRINWSIIFALFIEMEIKSITIPGEPGEDASYCPCPNRSNGVEKPSYENAGGSGNRASGSSSYGGPPLRPASGYNR